MSTIPFLLPLESGERISLSAAVSISNTFLLTQFVHSIPPTADNVPRIGHIIGVLLIYSFALSFANVGVIRWQFRKGVCQGLKIICSKFGCWIVERWRQFRGQRKKTNLEFDIQKADLISRQDSARSRASGTVAPFFRTDAALLNSVLDENDCLQAIERKLEDQSARAERRRKANLIDVLIFWIGCIVVVCYGLYLFVWH